MSLHLASARDLAVRHGFHEVSFKSEVLAEALAAARENRDAALRDERIETSIARFEELTVDEGVLTPA